MGGIKAGSLKRNKSEWERTQGPGSYLALCQALTALDVFRRGSWTQHLDHVYLLTPFSSANSSGSILGGDRLFLFYFFCLILSSNTPLTPAPPLLFMSQGCSLSFFSALWRGNKLVSWHGYFDWRYTLATCLWKQCQSTTWLNCHIGSPRRGLWWGPGLINIKSSSHLSFSTHPPHTQTHPFFFCQWGKTCKLILVSKQDFLFLLQNL